jgi:hypothetical protein
LAKPSTTSLSPEFTGKSISIVTNPPYLSDLFVHGGHDGKLTIAPTIAGNRGKLQPHYMLYEGDNLIQEFDEAERQIAHPHLWSIKDPFRYKLVTALGGEDPGRLFRLPRCEVDPERLLP